jgi:uncharacterized protein (TIGR02001 family)
MPAACLARHLLLLLPLLGCALSARADLGATVSLLTDARQRGLSYSGERPSAQLGLAWDGSTGWYAGLQIARAHFHAGERSSALQLYGGRVFELGPGLDAEAGLAVHRYGQRPGYAFDEFYAGLIGEQWTLRLFLSPDYYGLGQRSIYTEFKLRWPLLPGVAAVGQVGVLRGRGGASAPSAHGPARVDLSAGGSWQLGASSDLALRWVSVSRGGPYVPVESTRRRSWVLSLTTAF